MPRSVYYPLLACLGLLVPAATGADPEVMDEWGTFDDVLENHGPCIAAEERGRIDAEVRRNIERLETEGVLATQDAAAPTRTLFRFPLRAASHLQDPGFHYVLSHVNHAKDGTILDYNCGGRTHNSPISGTHNGTDYNIWPFTWNKMDNDDVEVVASASGTVIFRAEGNEDRSCPGALVGPSENGIIIRHYGDRSLGYYFHMKKGTLTTKQVGESIAAGNYLGIVGSSGASVSPHLHFEVRNSNGELIDPYAGPCNSYNSESWWQEQPPYHDPAVLKISTHMGKVVWSSCPDPDVTYLNDDFDPGSYIFYYVFGRDVDNGELFEFTIYDPQGDPVKEWSVTATTAFQKNYYFSRQEILSPTLDTGTYTYELKHLGNTYRHSYNVGTATPVTFADLDAVPETGGVWIRWMVTTDTRFSGFRIIRRMDGTTEETVLPPGLLGANETSFFDDTVEPGATYHYRVEAVFADGSVEVSGEVPVTIPRTALHLAQSFPNPFYSTTTIRFSLDRRVSVSLDVFDAQGGRMRNLVDAELPAGNHRSVWDGRNDAGETVSAGRYYYRLRADGQVQSRSLIVLRR